MSDLPTGVLRNIADNLDARNAKALASSSTALFASTRAVVAKAQLVDQAHDLYRLRSPELDAAVRDILGQAARIPDTEAAARDEVLRVIARKIDASGQQAVERVDEFLSTIAPLTQSRRAKAIEALASAPQTPQTAPTGVAVVQRLLQAIDALDFKHRAAPLTALATSFPALLRADVPAALALVQQSIAALDGDAAAQPLAAWARASSFVQGDVALQRQSFSFVASEIERLPEPAREAPLVELARLVHRLQQDSGLRFRQVADAVDALTPPHAIDALASLALQVKKLPDSTRKASFNERILPAIEKLPPALLVEFVQRLNHLQEPNDSQDPLLKDAVLRAIDRLPDALQGMALVAQAKQVSRVQTDAQTQTSNAGTDAGVQALLIFDELAQRLEGLRGGNGAAALAALGAQIGALPENRRQIRLDAVLHLCNAIPADHLGQPLSMLIQQMMGCPQSEALDRTWQAAMRLAAQLPPQDSAGLIARLTQVIPQLSESARQEAFERCMDMLRAVPTNLTGLRGNVLRDLAHAAGSLPQPAFATHEPGGPARALSTIVESAEGLSNTERQVILSACASELGKLSDPDSVADRIVKALYRLPAPGLTTPLTALFSSEHWPSLSADAMHRHVPLAVSMLSQLPTDDLALPLREAANQLPVDRLQQDVQAKAFIDLLQLVERLPGDKVTMPLTALANMLVKTSDPTALRQGFRRMLALVHQRTGNQLALGGLAKQLHALPRGEDLESAWKQVRSFVDRLPPGSPLCQETVQGLAAAVAQLEQPHSAWEDMQSLAERLLPASNLICAVGSLAQAVPRLQHRKQPSAMAWVLRMIGKLSSETDSGSRAQALVKVAAAIPHMAKEARQDAFEAVRRNVTDGDYASEIKADLLMPLALAAEHLPGFATQCREINSLLGLVSNIEDMSRKSEVLTTLAREALPRALERPASLLERLGQRHVTRESLLHAFEHTVESLPAHVRAPALQQMIDNASYASRRETVGTSNDKSARLLPMLQSLLDRTASAVPRPATRDPR